MQIRDKKSRIVLARIITQWEHRSQEIANMRESTGGFDTRDHSFHRKALWGDYTEDVGKDKNTSHVYHYSH